MDTLITILVIWLGLGGLAALIALGMTLSDPRDVNIIDVLGIVFLLCPFIVVFGPIGLLFVFFIDSATEEGKQRDEQERRRKQDAQQKLDMRDARSRRAAEERYILSRRWNDADQQDRALLEAEYQRLKRAQEEENRRPERAIVERLRAEREARRAEEQKAERIRSAYEARSKERELSAKMRRMRPSGSPPPQASGNVEQPEGTPAPRNWREERPPFWRD